MWSPRSPVRTGCACPASVGDDPLLHTALLTYASDYLLLDMVFRSYPGGYPPAGLTGFSLDHAIWFHRPVRFDEWRAPHPADHGDLR